MTTSSSGTTNHSNMSSKIGNICLMMFFVLFLPDVLHVFFDLTIFQHQKNWRQNCPRVAVGRWDSRLELLTRYTAQLKGPRHPQFMQGARDTQIPVSKNQVELGGLTFDDICWIFLERMFFQS